MPILDGFEAERAELSRRRAEVVRLQGALREIDEHVNAACQGDSTARNAQWLKSKLPISEIIERSLSSIPTQDKWVCVPRETLGNFIARVERLAFEMPPPNIFTPQFAQACIELRSILNRSLLSPGDATDG